MVIVTMLGCFPHNLAQSSIVPLMLRRFNMPYSNMYYYRVLNPYGCNGCETQKQQHDHDLVSQFRFSFHRAPPTPLPA